MNVDQWATWLATAIVLAYSVIQGVRRMLFARKELDRASRALGTAPSPPPALIIPTVADRALQEAFTLMAARLEWVTKEQQRMQEYVDLLEARIRALRTWKEEALAWKEDQERVRVGGRAKAHPPIWPNGYDTGDGAPSLETQQAEQGKPDDTPPTGTPLR